MGDEASGYLAQMMAMQGQRPRPAWTFIQQLWNQYESSRRLKRRPDEIKNVEYPSVTSPKNFSEKILFAVDQFVFKGGRTIVLVDPFSVADRADHGGDADDENNTAERVEF